MKRRILPLFSLLAVFAVFGVLTTVHAYTDSNYATTLELGPGRNVTGAVRHYTAGMPAMRFVINYFVKNSANENWSRMQYKFSTSDGYAYVDDNIYLPEDLIGRNELLAPQAMVPEGDYKWYYSTKVDGITYSGFYMNPVNLYTL